MRNFKTHAALAALIPLLLLFVLGDAAAQVTISERVELGSIDSLEIGLAKSLSTSDALVITTDGVLTVRYDSAMSAILPIYLDADLTVERNGQPFAVDTVRDHLGESLDFQNGFLCPPSEVNDLYRWYPGHIPPASAAGKTQSSDSVWTVGPVSKGDRITFNYEGGRDVYPQEYVTGPSPSTQDSSWLGGLYRCSSQYSPFQVYTDVVWFTALVVRDTLTIEIDDPKEVWPSIPNRPTTPLATTWHSQIISEVDNTLSPITATVTENGSPVASMDVELTMAWVDTSGGHVHLQGVPHLSGSSLGSLTLLAGTFISSTDSTIVATTDQNGKVSVSYTAGEFGGQVAFIASATIGSNEVTDEDTVTVMVPNLTMLPDVAQTEYKKLGGTLNHPGPDDNHFGDDYLHDPDYNHWVRPDVLSQIQAIISDWNAREDSVLYVNDMSLQNGGHFDINGIWTGAHASHRVGRDIDIKSTKWSSGVTGVYVSPDTLEDGSEYLFAEDKSIGNRGFEQIVLQNCGKVWPEHGIGHYHIRFYPDSMNNCE